MEPLAAELAAYTREHERRLCPGTGVPAVTVWLCIRKCEYGKATARTA